ncbi:hypothetical protein LCGC14_2231940, partial [marine sediment metagenome]
LADVNVVSTSSAQILVMNAQWTNVTLAGDGSIAVGGALTIGTSTRLRVDPTDCGANTFAISIDAEADLTCSSIDISDDTNLATSSPITLTGDTIGLDQNAGTDVTADLEEEIHATEHDIDGDDTVAYYGVVRDEGTDLTRRRNLNFTGSGVSCTDVGGTTSTDCTITTGGTSRLDGLDDTNISATSSAQILVLGTQWTNVVLSGDAGIDTSGILTVGTSTRLRLDPGDCGADTFAVSIDAEGDLTCTIVDFSAGTNASTTFPIILTGDNIGLSQNAGTDVTADLEEEDHASEHDIDGTDPVAYYGVVRDEGSDLTRRRNLNFIGAGVNCVDIGGTTSTDCTIAGGGGVSILDDLDDVAIGATSSAQILIMDTQWENQSLSGDVTITVAGVSTVTTSTALRLDPTDCGANTYAISIDPEGDLTCSSIDIGDDTNLAVSGTLLDLTGDTLSINEGTLTDNNLCDYEVTGTQIECVTNTKAELEEIITDVADFAEADGDVFTGVHNFGGATSLELPTCGSIPNVNGQICTRTATSTSELIWFQDELHILSGTTTKGFLLWDATSTDDLIMSWIDGGNAVVTKVCTLAEGGTNWIGSIQQYDQDGDNPTALMS